MPRQNKILIRQGTSTPNPSDFDVAEPAWDKSAGKLYIKNAAGSMVEIGSGGGAGVTDGDKGDITVTSLGATWTIDNGVVGTAKLGGDITTAGKALLDDADAAAQRSTLGLGTAATSNTGDFAAASHSHGNITNAGAIGSTSGVPIITGTSGVLQAGSFGSSAGTFCQGNDSRLSDTRNTTNSVTFNNAGAGGASGSTFNGGSALTVSYNTIGAPSTTGSGASGSWGISVTGSSASCTGNAATATSATQWSTGRTLSLTGDVTGTSAAFNGTANVSFATTLANGSVTAAKLSGAQTGSAPVYGARAWVNFNGTGTVAIRASGNVSSITDNGVGNYTVNFTTGMADTNYNVATSSRQDTDANENAYALRVARNGAFSASAVQVTHGYFVSPSNVYADCQFGLVSIFR